MDNEEKTPVFTEIPPTSKVMQKYQISTCQNSTRKSTNYCNAVSYNRWRELWTNFLFWRM